MKVLCLIDSLGPGGAQRQLVTLAIGLKERGHEIRFLVYHPHEHFLPLLKEAGIPCQLVADRSRWRRILKIRRILRQDWQDVVLAFLEAPSLYAEIARIPRRRWGLVVSERSAWPGIYKGSGLWLRRPHRVADAVVTNSHTCRLLLERALPSLKGKLTTVYNCVDFQKFRPLAQEDAGPAMAGGSTRLVVAASYQNLKNMQGVARAMLELKTDPAAAGLRIDWYGGQPANDSPFQLARQFVAEHGLQGRLNLLPATSAIAREFATASAVGLFSFFEGLPNVVCEGMACGKPIIMSDVCDAGALVREGENGFLCDPASPPSIAAALRNFVSTGPERRRVMGEKSRAVALRLFDRDEVIRRYEKILHAAMTEASLPADSAWPVEAPQSAETTIQEWTRTGFDMAAN